MERNYSKWVLPSWYKADIKKSTLIVIETYFFKANLLVLSSLLLKTVMIKPREALSLLLKNIQRIQVYLLFIRPTYPEQNGTMIMWKNYVHKFPKPFLFCVL